MTDAVETVDPCSPPLEASTIRRCLSELSLNEQQREKTTDDEHRSTTSTNKDEVHEAPLEVVATRSDDSCAEFTPRSRKQRRPSSASSSSTSICCCLLSQPPANLATASAEVSTADQSCHHRHRPFNHKSPEYTPGFFKNGATVAAPNFSKSYMPDKATTFIPMAGTTTVNKAKERLQTTCSSKGDRQQEALEREEVYLLNEWTPAPPLLTVAEMASNLASRKSHPSI